MMQTKSILMKEEAYYVGYQAWQGDGRATQRMETIWDNTCGIQGAKLFDCLSREVRGRGDADDSNLLEKFEIKLETLLATMSHEPRLHIYFSAQRSNSITTQVGGVRDGGEGLIRRSSNGYV